MAASNGSVAPNAHITKSLKSTSFNGREAQVTEVIIPHKFVPYVSISWLMHVFVSSFLFSFSD